MGLKTEYSLSQQDWDFVKTLIKVAHVHVLSRQVSILIDRSNRSFETDKDNKLTFPPNWSLQWVGIEPSKYEDNHAIKMTWEVFPL